jgi:hypothetical protein
MHVDRKHWVALLIFWSAAAVLSAIQIFLRDVSRGFAPPWPDVLLANFLAWLPWLGIAPLALGLERRFPLTRERWQRHAALHAVVAIGLSAAFLFYLALFHLIWLEGHRLPLDPALLRAEYADKLGRFYLTSVLLYLTICVAGLACRGWQAQRDSANVVRGPDPLVIRSTGRVERIDPAEVCWIEGCGNYARLHLEGRSVLLRRTLASLAADLGPDRFARIHRSTIVNVGHVAGLRRRSHGEATLVLRDGQRLKVSRTYRDALQRLVG